MRANILATLASSPLLLVLVVPGASADVAIPAPGLAVDDDGVHAGASWCTLVAPEPTPCRSFEEWVHVAPGDEPHVQPICLRPGAVEGKCIVALYVALPSGIILREDGVVVEGNACHVGFGEPAGCREPTPMVTATTGDGILIVVANCLPVKDLPTEAGCDGTALLFISSHG